jgi:F0F1-type ATP synthase membrane subunit c/vacuolar-type H+-ATPase subunit K
MKKSAFIITSFLAIPLYAETLQESLANLNTSVHVMIYISFIVISMGMLSSAYALSTSLMAYAACEEKNRNIAFIPAVMPGSQGLYSFAISFMMIRQLGTHPIQVALAGIICGLPCLLSAIGQAKTAAACIKSINNEQMNIGQALLATCLPELYALTGLAGAFIVLAA